MGREENCPNNGAAARHEELLQHYFGSGKEPGLHVSRTLDQYYYSSLPDTVRRDADQVVRRYQARKFKEKAERVKERDMNNRKTKAEVAELMHQTAVTLPLLEDADFWREITIQTELKVRVLSRRIPGPTKLLMTGTLKCAWWTSFGCGSLMIVSHPSPSQSSDS